MPVCIAGMHRSGTSMVARLLQDCGLFLGPEEELGSDVHDGEPHWEHLKFVALNDKILERMGGSWENPPELPSGWELTRQVDGLTSHATKLIKTLRGRKHWGWKDPRNSLTLPFWRRVIPDLDVIICVRNPLEVAYSLQVRGDPICIPVFDLWLRYYRQLVSAIPSQTRVVTHYDTYFREPVVELQRVANEIGLEAPAGMIERACANVSEDLRHHRMRTVELAAMNVPHEVLALYRELCLESGLQHQG